METSALPIIVVSVFGGMIILVIGFRALTRLARARNKRTAREVAEIIEKFLAETDGPYDWDEFLTIPIHDHELDQVREHCADLPRKFPPDRDGQYCSDLGKEEMARMAARLRSALEPPSTCKRRESE